MKNILLFISLILLFVSCKEKRNNEKYFYDIDLKIVSINSDESITKDKFHKPQTCNIVLFKTMGEDKLYREFNTCNLPKSCGCNGKSGINIDTEWIYNHRPGDIVHFKYLLKDKFFRINRK